MDFQIHFSPLRAVSILGKILVDASPPGAGCLAP